MSRNDKLRPSAPENRVRRLREARKSRLVRVALRVAIQVGSFIALCREAILRWKKYNP